MVEDLAKESNGVWFALLKHVWKLQMLFWQNFGGCQLGEKMIGCFCLFSESSESSSKIEVAINEPNETAKTGDDTAEKMVHWDYSYLESLNIIVILFI